MSVVLKGGPIHKAPYFVCEKRHLVVDALVGRKPVKLLEDR